MHLLRLLRHRSTDQGTPGVLLRDDRRLAYTLELPWRDNERQVSCIPTGLYAVERTRTPRHGEVYHLVDVPGRSNILIHSGNVAGASPPYETHVLGCILLGQYLGQLRGQLAVLVSRPAVRLLEETLQRNPFTLEVSWAS